MIQIGMITEWCPFTGSREGQRGGGEGSSVMGDQRRTFVLLNGLMSRTLDHVMPTSSSDDDLASRFS